MRFGAGRVETQPVSVLATEASVLLVPERAGATSLDELSRTPRYRLVGRVEAMRSARDAVRLHRPDVVVAEVSTPERLHELAALLQDGLRVRTVVVSGLPPQVALLTSLAAGVRGFVRKPLGPGDVEEAVSAVLEGNAFVDTRSTGWLIELAVHGHRTRPQDGLTLRQSQVVELVRGGLTNREIAHVLGVSLPTVKSHLHEAMRRLGVGDRWAATVLAERLREDRS
ncbi:MAG: response regulator transcription factor [Actinomycetota bacterium]|nr:response regulator transcription factor [Actinomycetota bacterium]